MRTKAVNGNPGRCYLCGWPIMATSDPNHPLAGTIDHVVPRCLGGPDHWKNKRVAHRYCNLHKDSQMVSRDMTARLFRAVEKMLRPYQMASDSAKKRARRALFGCTKEARTPCP